MAKQKGQEIGSHRASDEGKNPGECWEYRVYSATSQKTGKPYTTCEIFKPFQFDVKDDDGEPTGEKKWGKSYSFFPSEIDILISYLNVIKAKFGRQNESRTAPASVQGNGPNF